MTDSADAYEGKLKRRRRWLWWLVSWSLFALAVVFVAKLIFIRAVTVSDQSMYPGIDGGSVIWCIMGGDPEVSDIVLVDLDGKPVLRRIVAGPGGTVRVSSEGIEVDGDLIARSEVEDQTYFSQIDGALGVREVTCHYARSEIGELDVGVCTLGQLARDEDPLELSDDEYYVRCDNRAFCARRESSEGVVKRTQIRGRARWLMGTSDDSDQPFYKRWFGRFESLN